MEKEWGKFRDVVKRCTNDVCGMRCVGGREERGASGAVKKLVCRYPKSEELLKNGSELL